MKFFFGLLAFIAATVVVVLLVISLFRGFDDTSSSTTVSSTYSVTDSTAIDTVARYTVSGPVVADENYRQIRITISKNSRTLEVLKGYAGAVEKTQTFPNTPEAYRAFLGALDAANYANKRDGITSEPASTCVTGNKYYYELASGSDRKVDTWTSSCALNAGTFAGNHQGTALLFRKQIPTYSQLTSGVTLYSL